MERLTREVTIIIRGKELAACNYENDDCNDSCIYGTCRWQKKANMLLKKYEDTGLNPEQIMELKERDTGMLLEDIWANKKDNGHLIFGTCPNCGRRVSNVEGGKFCQNCGQRLKWEEER